MSVPVKIELPDGRVWIAHDGVLWGADIEVAAYVQERLQGQTISMMFAGLGLLHPDFDIKALTADTVMGALIGGALFFNHVHEDDCSDITVTVANYDERTGHPDVIARVLTYPFEQLKLRRISAEIIASNERSIRNAETLGFKIEGMKRRAGPGGDDIVILGLLPEECAVWQRYKKTAA